MNDNLDVLIDRFGIFDPRTGKFPNSEDERCVIKIQLMAAKIIAGDVLKIKRVSPNLSTDEITEQLLHNWAENIRDFSCAVIKARNAGASTFMNVESGMEYC